jgi:hypothetical protein
MGLFRKIVGTTHLAGLAEHTPDGNGKTLKGGFMSGAIGDAKGVDLNTASREALERVDGLGRERAEKIIASRPFNDWNEVKDLEGFSETLVRDLQQAGATISRGSAA